MNRRSIRFVFVLSALVWLSPLAAGAQTPAPAAASSTPGAFRLSTLRQSSAPVNTQPAEDAVERTVKRFRLGVQGGVGVDPELLMFGGHGTFGPLFTPGVDFRPGIEFGVGELTTLMGINLDVLYTLPGAARGARWTPYVGAGPNFALSHQGFDSDDVEDDDRNRFDFSDTDFEGGFNFIAGARNRNGMFIEMKATAYGVSNVRLLVGYNF